MKPPFVRNPYNYDMREAGRETALICPEPTRAQQQFKDESDINFIADRYGLTGELPQIDGAMWGNEFVGIFDFQQAQNQVIEAKRQFMTLPAKLRSRFENNPQKLLDFLEDPDNLAEAQFLGLVKPQPTPPTTGTPETPTGTGDTLSPPPEKPSGGPSNPPTAT